MYYECRITRDTIENIELLFPKSAWFREGGVKDVKIHYHGLIDSDITATTIRNRLKKQFNLQGNGGYKVSNVKNIESYKAYMSKNKQCVYNGLEIDFDKYKWEEKTLSKIEQMFKDYTGQITDNRALTKYMIKYYLDQQKLININQIATYIRTWKAMQGITGQLEDKICDLI